MKNASGMALAALALLSNVACTSFAPVSPTTLAPDARVRLSAPSGLVLVGGTPDAPEPLLTCEVRDVTGKVTRVVGDSVVLTNIFPLTPAPGAHPRCGRIAEGVVYAQADASVTVEQRQADSEKTAAFLIATAIIVGSMAYALSQMTLVASK